MQQLCYLNGETRPEGDDIVQTNLFYNNLIFIYKCPIGS